MQVAPHNQRRRPAHCMRATQRTRSTSYTAGVARQSSGAERVSSDSTPRSSAQHTREHRLPPPAHRRKSMPSASAAPRSQGRHEAHHVAAAALTTHRDEYRLEPHLRADPARPAEDASTSPKTDASSAGRWMRAATRRRRPRAASRCRCSIRCCTIRLAGTSVAPKRLRMAVTPVRWLAARGLVGGRDGTRTRRAPRQQPLPVAVVRRQRRHPLAALKHILDNFPFSNRSRSTRASPSMPAPWAASATSSPR